MASKYFKAFNFFKKKGTVAPTITQPRQLPGTMKKIRSQYEKFGFKKAKTATDRANIVRNKKSIERMEKLDKAKAKRKEGIKASKEVKKMVDTGQAKNIGGQVFHKSVREKKAMGGGVTGAIDKIKKKEPKKDSIKEKIMPSKKKKRLEELRKELGMKKGGRAKKKFPDLTGDGKVTQADILKGRGVFRKGGSTTFKDLKKKGVISDKVKVKEFNKLKKQFGGGKK
jgi:hypothetical protein